jgi:predicted transcriptional regulator
MIEMFNDVEVRNTGLIYSSTFEQIKKMYAVDPEKAGELAISAIELVLTGQISSDDIMVDMLLAPAKAINDNNVAKYESKVENSRQKKIREMKLAEIAEMYQKGFKQREIAERLHLSQQIVSYRIGVIKTTYPDLLQPEGTQTAQINSDVYKNTNSLQKNLQTEYKNTNDTKKQNSVQICEEEEFVKEDERIEVGVKSPDGKKHFVF